MILVVEFRHGTGTQHPVAAAPMVSLRTEANVADWLGHCRISAYVRRLFDPYGFLWSPRDTVNLRERG